MTAVPTVGVAGAARAAATAGYHEFRAMIDLRTWLGGYVVRLAFQVVFFTMVGRFVGGQELVHFLLVGNILAIIAMQGVANSQTVLHERIGGTLMLLTASPTDGLAAILARNAIRIVLSLVSSILVLVTLMLAFRMLPPILLVVAVSCYCYGCFMAALVYRFEWLQSAASNVSYLAVTVLAGVNVPTDYWPRPVQLVSDILPVTHGLRAVRALTGQVPMALPAVQVLLELLVGVGWLVAAMFLLRRWIEADRAAGRIDLR